MFSLTTTNIIIGICVILLIAVVFVINIKRELK